MFVWTYWCSVPPLPLIGRQWCDDYGMRFRGEVVKISDTMTQSQLTIQSDERFNKFPSKTFTRRKAATFRLWSACCQLLPQRRKKREFLPHAWKRVVIFEWFRVVKSERTFLGIFRPVCIFNQHKANKPRTIHFHGEPRGEKKKVLKDMNLFWKNCVSHQKPALTRCTGENSNGLAS